LGKKGIDGLEHARDLASGAQAGRTRLREAAAYLNCPRCGLVIVVKTPWLAARHCPRCLARDRVVVDLFRSQLPADLLYAPAQAPRLAPAPRASPTTERRWHPAIPSARGRTLNVLVTLEDAFIAAYCVDRRDFSTGDLGVTAALNMGIQSDHRALARVVAPGVVARDGGPIEKGTDIQGKAERPRPTTARNFAPSPPGSSLSAPIRSRPDPGSTAVTAQQRDHSARSSGSPNRRSKRGGGSMRARREPRVAASESSTSTNVSEFPREVAAHLRSHGVRVRRLDRLEGPAAIST